MIEFVQFRSIGGAKPRLFIFRGRWTVISPTGAGFNLNGYPEGRSFGSFREAAEKAKECWTCKPRNFGL